MIVASDRKSGHQHDIAFARLQHAIERVWRTSAFHKRYWLDHGIAENWVPESPVALRKLPPVVKEDLLAVAA